MGTARRFQFRLQDLLVIQMATLVCMAVFLFVSKRPPLPSILFAYITVLTICGFGGWLGILSSERNNHVGIARGVVVLTGICLSWIVAGLVCSLLFIPVIPCGGPQPERNEWTAAASCRAFVEAEKLYFQNDFESTGIHAYARSLKDLWVTSSGKELGLIDRSSKDAEGLPGGNQTPKCCYCFKMLFAQGRHAKQGPMSYLVDGKMTGGFAIAAYPYCYGESVGLKTFVVNQDGIVFSKDLGEQTNEIVTKMTEFDPDKSWDEQ
jgi:hypothetical protein